MNQNWGVLACIGAFGLTFAAGMAVVVGQRQDPPRPVAAAPADPEPKKEDPPKPPDRPPEKPADKKDDRTAKVARPNRPTLIKQWQGTPPPKPKGEDSPNYEDFFYRELAMDRHGTKVLGYTNREAVCWDAFAGIRLQTFPAATHTTPRKPPNPPDFHIDQHIRISADARRVALIDRNGKSVTLYDASSGSKVGTYTAPRDRSKYLDSHPPEFTPQGGYLLYCISGGGNRDEICAVSSTSASGRKVSLGRAYTNESFDWIVLIPWLADATFIRQQRGDTVTALDLRTGKERRLTSITLQPFSLFENRGIKMSPDGRYLSARGIKAIEVVDWKEDRRVMRTGAETIHNEWWTPCGKRLVLHKSTNWIQYVDGVRTTPIGGWLELWDVEKGVKINTFAQDKVGLKSGVTALAFTEDGKRFALADRAAHIAILDFEMAFGVAPLPAAARPEGPESLP